MQILHYKFQQIPNLNHLNLSHSLIIIAQYVSNIIKSRTSSYNKVQKGES